MRTLRHAACIVVAAASLVLAAWQPNLTPAHDPADASASDIKRVDRRVPQQPVDRAILNAPLLKT